MQTALLAILPGLIACTGTHHSQADEARPLAAPDARFEILAHRGVHVMWKRGAYDPITGCEAEHIESPSHDLVENTLPSIRRAFDLGATIVEIDIRRSGDDQLMVFHDLELACKTNGKGKVAEQPASHLRTLDVGFGYTSDGGRTFPLRGKGIGLMPTLSEVLDAFPQERFLIDHKDATRETAELLARTLRSRTTADNRRVFYWGPVSLHRLVARQVPEVRRLFLDRAEIKTCLLPYLLSASLGDFSASCRQRTIGIDRKHARMIPGWPSRFLAAAERNDTSVFLMVDSAEDVAYFRDLRVAGIVTDHIAEIAPHLATPRASRGAPAVVPSE